MRRNTIILDDLLQKLNRRIEHLEVSINDIIPILQYILEIVEETTLKGPQKKGLAISLLKQIINNSDLKKEDKEDCYIIINNGIISDTIDLVISASKKNIKINKKISFMKKWSSKTLRKNKNATRLQKEFGNNNKRKESVNKNTE